MLGALWRVAAGLPPSDSIDTNASQMQLPHSAARRGDSGRAAARNASSKTTTLGTSRPKAHPSTASSQSHNLVADQSGSAKAVGIGVLMAVLRK